MKFNFKIFKRILTFAIILPLCFTTIGCGGNKKSKPSQPLFTPAESGPSVFNGAQNNTASNENTVSGSPSENTTSDSSSKNSHSSSKPSVNVESSVSDTQSKPASSSSDTSAPELKLPFVSCWGDSLTEGMSVPVANNFPTILNNFIGTDKFKVLNGGDGGEDTITIMARQGALKIFTSNKITFKAGDATVRIGDSKGNGFETANGEVIRLTAALGREMPINDITIGSQKYKLVLSNFDWSDRSCNVYLQRTSGFDSALTIEKGTEVKFASAELAKTNHCDIYLMGANGGYNNDVNTLIDQHKKMIEYRGNDNYLVIIPYWTSNTYTKSFIDAFGDKAVDFRAAATDQSILEDTLHLHLTDLDKAQISSSQKNIPPCLRLDNSSTDVHLNQNGYLLLARLLHARGQELGYW